MSVRTLVSVCEVLVDKCLAAVETPEGSKTTRASLQQDLVSLRAEMARLRTRAEEEEREVGKLKAEVSALRVALRTDMRKVCEDEDFCFTPLGGGRPDCAVVACAAVSANASTSTTPPFPGDVVDVALAALCVPGKLKLDELIVRDLNDDDFTTQYNPEYRYEDEEQWDDDMRFIFQLPPEQIEIDDGFLSGCDQAVDIDLRVTHITKIYDSVFASCCKLTSVSLPRSLTEVGKHFLSNCKKLRMLDLSATGVTCAKDAFLSGCVSLTSVTLPPGLEDIGSSFLSRCKGVVKLELPASVNSIGSHFMSGCQSIKEIDLHHLTLDGWRGLDSYFLCGCSNLISVKLPDSIDSLRYKFVNDCPKLEAIDLSNTAIECIPSDFLTGCVGLTSVKLPDCTKGTSGCFLEGCRSLEYVEIPAAFSECVEHYFMKGCTSLKELDLSHTSVTSAACDFLAGNTSLTTLKLPETFTGAGPGFIERCPALKQIYIGDMQVGRDDVEKLHEMVAAAAEKSDDDEDVEDEDEDEKDESDDEDQDDDKSVGTKWLRAIRGANTNTRDEAEIGNPSGDLTRKRER